MSHSTSQYRKPYSILGENFSVTSVLNERLLGHHNNNDINKDEKNDNKINNNKNSRTLVCSTYEGQNTTVV